MEELVPDRALCAYLLVQVTLSMEYLEEKVGIVFSPEKVCLDEHSCSMPITTRSSYQQSLP
jgi:hypothetical protein